MSKICVALVVGAAVLGTATPSLADSANSVSFTTWGDVAKAKARHRSRRNNGTVDHRLPECDPLALTLGPCRGREPQVEECDPLALTLKPCR